MRTAVFFERDGILNRAPASRYRISPPTLDQFQINKEAIKPLHELKQAGFLLIATTNQPGLSRGYQSRRELDLMHEALTQRLELDDILVCPHDEMDECPCRKPKPGLLIEAAFKWHLDLEHCFMVSEKWQDAKAAHVASCSSILVRSPLNGSGHHDFVLPNLVSVVRKILRLHRDMVPGPPGRRVKVH